MNRSTEYYPESLIQEIGKSVLDLIKRQKAEIESLKHRKTELQIRNQELQHEKSEAIKEFAERLKIEIISDTAYGCDCNQHSGYYDNTIKIGDIPEYIDNLVKEMEGEECTLQECEQLMQEITKYDMKGGEE